MRLLLVEDEPALAAQLRGALTQSGFAVDLAPDGEDAELLGDITAYDAIVLDLGLPGRSGLAVLRHWRQRGVKTPVLILTARADWHSKVEGLNTGADDYLGKPFVMEELLARVRALIRRANSVLSALLTCGELELDTARHSATLAGTPLDLTAREWAILEMLVMRSPQVVPKDKLLQSLSGWDKDMSANAIEVHISRLRSKLADSGINIRTVRGIGYRLDDPGHA